MSPLTQPIGGIPTLRTADSGVELVGSRLWCAGTVWLPARVSWIRRRVVFGGFIVRSRTPLGFR